MARQYRHRHRKPAQRTRRITCRIERLGHQGDGIADVDGQSIFIPLTLAGETVEVDVSGERGQVVSVSEPSPDRIEPICPHFGTCGGCSLQHFEVSPYRDWKRDVVVNALRNRGIDCEVAPIVDGHGDGRRRVTVHAVATANGAIAGFNRHRDRRIIDIDHCPVLDPALSSVFDLARSLAEVLSPARGGLHLRAVMTDAGLDLDIGGFDPNDLGIHEALATFAARHDIARLTLGSEPLLERRPPVIRMGQAEVVPAPGGFLQATRAGEDILSDLVLRGVPEGAAVADLFCGVGPFSLRLATTSPVISVDVDEAAINALDHAVRHTEGLKPISIVRRDLFDDPLDAQELSDRDCVVFDPPRAGAEAQARKLAVSGVNRIVGVSCNPVTFARDAGILIDGGFTLRSVTPVDQFRHTAHVEMVGVFDRSA